MIHPKLLFPSPPPTSSIYVYTHTCSRVLWSNCLSETKVNPPHIQMVVVENPGQDSCGRFQSWGYIFQKGCVGGFSQELAFSPGRGTEGVWPGAAWMPRGRRGWGGWAASPGDGFGLWALSSPVLGHGWSAQPQMLPAPHLGDPRPAPHTCGPPACHPRALGEGIKVPYKWPAWEGFPYGIGFNSVWLLFPFKLDSGWDSFLSGGSQLPRCCHFLFYVSVEYFSFIFRIFFFFCHQKNTFELRVPCWLWL